MALYPKAVRKLIPPGDRDPRIDPDQAVVHVDAGNAATLYGWFTNPDANGVESHFHVRRDGVVEQYRDTAYQADAQVGGAAHAVSIETQGYGDGEWTPEQLRALVDLLTWLTTVHPKIRRRVCPDPYAAGVGYHSLFPSSMAGTWARDGRTCPGPKRIQQFRNTLMPALAGTDPLEDDMPLTTTDVDKVADEVWTRPVIDHTGARVPVGVALGVMLREAHGTALNARDAARDAAVARALAEQAAQAAGPLSAGDVAAITSATVAAVDAHLDARDRALADALAAAGAAPDEVTP